MLRSAAVSPGTAFRSSRAALATLLALGSTACAPRTLDLDQLEQQLGRTLADRLEVPRLVVDCPAEVEVHADATFACIARVPGETTGIRVLVTQTDDDGHVAWRLAGTAE
jgi:hypothetical protein